VTLGLGRAIAAGLLAAFAGVTWLALFYAGSANLRLDFDITAPPSILDGVYPSEREPPIGRTFAWTADTVTFNLPDLDRQAEWMITARVRSGRGPELPTPEISCYVDGVLVLTRKAPQDYDDVQIAVPSRPARSGLRFTMRVAPTFTPGPGDPRMLGVQLDALSITPSGIVLPPSVAVSGVALASAAGGAAIGLLGVTAGTAVGSAVLLTAGIAALVQRGFGPYTDYPMVTARAAAWVMLVTAVLTMIAQRLRGQPLRNTAKFAVAFTASAMLLKLLALLHPNMPIGDALFHAHRFQDVVGGRLYFTSIAPGNYRFPYAPGLYVVAMLFARMVRRGASDMTLLRSIVCSADALAGLLLYSMTIRLRGDRLSGALAVALYHLIPLGFAVIVTGNLTNAFAQSVMVAALALIALGSLRLEQRWMVVLLTTALTAAFLSHTSAFAIGVVGVTLIVWMFWWRGGPALRSPAAAVAIALLASIVLSVALYYAYFVDTYRTELTRIGSETAAGAPAVGRLTILDRLRLVPGYLSAYFGLPTLVLMVGGVVLLWQRGARDRVTLSVVGWMAACALFLILGILTPVDMRHYLAAIPAVAVIAAVGASIAWSNGGWQRVTAAALLGWAVFIGVQAWWRF
jgi:hypothetical protein